MHRKMMRSVSLLVSAVLLLSMMLPVFALGETKVGPCEHHTQHDSNCGYVAAGGGIDCNHPDECADTDGDGKIEHIEGCAYQSAKAGHPCEYVCPICNATPEPATEEPTPTDEPTEEPTPEVTEEPSEGDDEVEPSEDDAEDLPDSGSEDLPNEVEELPDENEDQEEPVILNVVFMDEGVEVATVEVDVSDEPVLFDENYLTENDEQALEEIAEVEELEAEKVLVGWFHDGAEFGTETLSADIAAPDALII